MWKRLAFALCLAGFGAGQTAPLPRFDVVSVKPSPPGEPIRQQQQMLQQVGGYWAGNVWTVQRLIVNAYQMGANLIVGMPAWAGQRYDIEARMPPDTTPQRFHLMLQALLADRFQMRAHIERRPTEIVVMTGDKPGPEMRPPSGKCAPPGQSGPYPCGEVILKLSQDQQELTGYSVSMADFADFFRAAAFHPVVDATGWKDLYDCDITIEIPPRVSGESTDDYQFAAAAAVQSSIRKQLGVAIDMNKPVKRPFPILVIDHLSPASAN